MPHDLLQQGWAATVYPADGSPCYALRIHGTPSLKRSMSAKYDSLGLTADNEQRRSPPGVKDRVEVYQDGVLVFNGYVISVPAATDTESGSSFEVKCASAPYLLDKKLTREWTFTGRSDLEVLQSLFLETFEGDAALASLDASLDPSSTNVEILEGRLQLKHDSTNTFLHPGSARSKRTDTATPIKTATLRANSTPNRVRVADASLATTILLDQHDGAGRYASAPSTVTLDPPFAWVRAADNMQVATETFAGPASLQAQNNVVADGALRIAGYTLQNDFETSLGRVAFSGDPGNLATRSSSSTLLASSTGPWVGGYLTPGVGDTGWDHHPWDDDHILFVTGQAPNQGTSPITVQVVVYTVSTDTWGNRVKLEIVANTGNGGNVVTSVARYNGGLYVFADFKQATVHTTYAVQVGGTTATPTLTLIGAGAEPFRRSVTGSDATVGDLFEAFDYEGTLYGFGWTDDTGNGVVRFEKYTPGVGWGTTTDPFGLAAALPTVARIGGVQAFGSRPRITSLQPGLLAATAANQNSAPVKSRHAKVWDGAAWVTTAATEPADAAWVPVFPHSTPYALWAENPTRSSANYQFLVKVGDRNLAPTIGSGMGAHSLDLAATDYAGVAPTSDAKQATITMQIYPYSGGKTAYFTLADKAWQFRVTTAGVVQYLNHSNVWTSLPDSLTLDQWGQLRFVIDVTDASNANWTCRPFVRGFDEGLITGSSSGAPTATSLGVCVFGDGTGTNHFAIDGLVSWASLVTPSSLSGQGVVATFAATRDVHAFWIEHHAGSLGSIQYEVSVDDGANYYPTPVTTDPAEPQWVFVTTPLGSNVRVRATLSTLDPAQQPVVYDYSLHLAAGYVTGTGYIARTLDVGDGDTVGATITIHANGDGTSLNVPASTTMTWRVSSDGGLHWTTHAGPGNTATIPPAERGKDIRVEATLTTSDATKTPTLSSIRLTIAEPVTATTTQLYLSRDDGATWHAATVGSVFDFTPYTTESPTNRFRWRFDLDTTDSTASPGVDGIEFDLTLEPLPYIKFGSEALGEVVSSLDPYPLQTYNQSCGGEIRKIVSNLQVDAWWTLDTATKTYTFHYNAARPAGPGGTLGNEVLMVETRVDGQDAADAVVVGGNE